MFLSAASVTPPNQSIKSLESAEERKWNAHISPVHLLVIRGREQTSRNCVRRRWRARRGLHILFYAPAAFHLPLMKLFVFMTSCHPEAPERKPGTGFCFARVANDWLITFVGVNMNYHLSKTELLIGCASFLLLIYMTLGLHVHEDPSWCTCERKIPHCCLPTVCVCFLSSHKL